MSTSDMLHRTETTRLVLHNFISRARVNYSSLFPKYSLQLKFSSDPTRVPYRHSSCASSRCSAVTLMSSCKISVQLLDADLTSSSTFHPKISAIVRRSKERLLFARSKIFNPLILPQRIDIRTRLSSANTMRSILLDCPCEDSNHCRR